MAYTPPNQAAIASQNALTAAASIAASVLSGQGVDTDTATVIAFVSDLREAFFDRTMEVVGEAPAVQDIAPSSGGGSSAAITFGKYAGRTIEDLVSQDRGYVEWLSKNARETNVKLAASAALG